MSEPLRTVNVGLIGLGTVGGGVARLIKSHHDEYLAAYGIDLKLTRACALAWEQAEAAGIEREAFTSDWHDVVTDPAVDIVVELIGGEHPATEIFTTAFEHGKHVVSANKALLGRHVETLAEKARACGVQIKCEASCGGGIPIVSTLEHDLVGNKILTIAGILNGTTNYILSRMDAEGADYADVLADAQARVQPPSDKGRRLKIYYITQVGVKPPHFVFFCNDSRLFHFSYQRYLENQIRAVFGLTGTPIRITIRQKGDKEEV